MPNIALLNYCNLNCSYCFANDFILEEKKFLSLDNFNYILNFLDLNELTKIGIIGGEPTLHPDFSNFIKILKEKFKKSIVVFTNGIELASFYDLFDENTVALININHPNIIKENNYKKLINTLDVFKNNNKLQYVRFGINLYEDIPDYDFFIDLCKKYNQNQIRCSYVAPTKQCQKNDKEAYYLKGKKLFLDFIESCFYENINVELDCNHIPECYFTKEEIVLLNKVISKGWHKICEPTIDFTPDLKAASCFGNYNPIDITVFTSYDDLYKFFQITNNMKINKNNFNEKCNRCSEFYDKKCQGGCLSFVE